MLNLLDASGCRGSSAIPSGCSLVGIRPARGVSVAPRAGLESAAASPPGIPSAESFAAAVAAPGAFPARMWRRKFSVEGVVGKGEGDSG